MQGGATAAAALRTHFCTADMPVAALILIECELCVYVLNTTLNQSARILDWLLIVGYEAYAIEENNIGKTSSPPGSSYRMTA
jgi:hypothetical protein